MCSVNLPGPLKSKFENESDEEEHEEKTKQKSRSRSPPSDEDIREYVEDTPPQSPVELADDLPVYLPAIQVQ